MLEVHQLRAGYGAINALWDVSIEVKPGTTVAIIGPNGAGKTTLLRAIMGLVPVTSGRVSLAGNDVTGLSTWAMVDRKVAMIPEGRMIFPDLTVYDNLMVGGFRTKTRVQVRRNLMTVCDLFPRLRDRQDQLAGSLSGGEAQMLAMGRGLMQEPDILLIDEPSLGLAPIIVDEIFGIIKKLTSEHRTIVLIEQNTSRAYAVADHIYLLRAGEVVMSTTPNETTLEALQKLYFIGDNAVASRNSTIAISTNSRNLPRLE